MKKLYFLLSTILITQFAVSQPANDDCANAEFINVTTDFTAVNFEISTAVINNEVGCDGDTAADFADIWYDFNMPINGNIFIDGTSSWNRFALYDTCGGTQIQCGTADELYSGLTAGTNYKLRVYRTAALATNTSYLNFSIKAYPEVANDDCASAQTLTVTTEETIVNFEIGGATVNNEEGCTGTTSDYIDIWYDFNMPVNGNLFIAGTTSWNSFALYDTCGGTQIQCGSSDELYSGLTAGTNYKLRLFRTVALADNTYLNFSIKAYPEVANDDCASAENITVTTEETIVDFEIGGATINNEEGCAGTTNDYVDLWYDFNMPVNGNVFIAGTSTWNNFALYDTCGGTQIQCGSSDELYSGLTAGTNYKLRLFRTVALADNTYLNFSIKAYPEATNDDCASAENITITTEETTVDFEIGGATINNEEGCIGTTSDYVDIWYDFNMPFNGNVFVAGASTWNNFALYDACGGTQIQCGSSDELYSSLTAGANYKLRLYRTVALADNTYLSFSIKAYPEALNDDCASAQTLTVTTEETTVDFEIAGATINNEEGCTGTTNDYVDIWYDFTMPVNGNLYIEGAINWNNFALYDACGGTQIHCGSTNELIGNLSSGTNYKLRVFRTIANAENNYLAFTIQAYENVTNDDCASAEDITVTTTETTIDFEIGGATINNEVGCTGAVDDYVDIWYNFTMPVNGNLYVDASINWNQLALYDSCGGTQIQCDDTNQLFTGLSATVDYKLRLFRTENSADNTYRSFTIQAFEIINNDDCASAENIIVTETPTTVNFGIGGATINNEIGCTGTTAQDYADVWYDFTMPIDGYILIDGNIGWNNFALYDACNGNELGCFSNEGTIAGLTNGTEYKLRVFRTLALADNESYKNFTIQSTKTLSTNISSLENTIHVYPNPADTVITISNINNTSISSIELFNMLGKKVLKTKSETIDVSSFQIGIYLLKIETEKGQVTKRIVIQ
ncbi:T9SS type A sorting domain-containing protein [Lacinutrix cladophorae]